MFATFDRSKFPIIKVTLQGTIETDEDFYNFSNYWNNLYTEKQDFTFIFDTEECGLIPLKYCVYMALFIRNLKKEQTQYLKGSSIYVYNSMVLQLLKFIFYMQKPIAPVSIHIKYLTPEKIETIEP